MNESHSEEADEKASVEAGGNRDPQQGNSSLSQKISASV